MRSDSVKFIRLAGVCALVMLGTSAARGQCGASTSAYDQIGTVSGNPFHAEIVITRTEPSRLREARPPVGPRAVARDSQGRVRIESVAGSYKHDTGSDAGLEAQQHFINICDTGAETLTRIDSLNATAQITHSRLSAAPARQPGRTFCSLHLPFQRNPNVPVGDLGDQIIEGVAAHGKRITLKPLLGGAGDAPADVTIQEIWCSDELAAIVLKTTESTRTGDKSSVAMQKIERTEPDPALFEIPEGYAVTESVAPAKRIQPKDGETGAQR